MLGLYLEEIEIGRRLALGSHMFSAEKIKDYARRFGPVDIHLDDAAARAGMFGALSACGLHVASGWMACFVASNDRARAEIAARDGMLPELGPSPGFTKMRWIKPVLADDVVSFFVTATDKRALKSRPGWGIVSSFSEGINQHGLTVFSFEGAVMTAMRRQ